MALAAASKKHAGQFAVTQDFPASRPGRKQDDAAGWLLRYFAARSHELSFAAREKQTARIRHPLVKPPRAGQCVRQPNSLSVIKELFQPRNLSVARSKGGIHPDKSTPLLQQTVFVACVSPLRRNVAGAMRRGTWVQIELAAEAIEYLGWRPVFVAFTALFGRSRQRAR